MKKTHSKTSSGAHTHTHWRSKQDKIIKVQQTGLNWTQMADMCWSHMCDSRGIWTKARMNEHTHTHSLLRFSLSLSHS